jgi:hypothetical protein
MKLHLGVQDFPTSLKGKSTGDIAEILEDKYSIMGTFFALHSPAIAALLEHNLKDSLEDALAGGSGGVSFQGAESAIGTLFRAWLSSRGMDGLAPGVPTAAAQRGVSHRFKHPYARRGARPSFIDTGTYVAAFTAWVDGVPTPVSTSNGAVAASEDEGEAATTVENVLADALDAL